METFGEAAVLLAGASARELGWSPETFWNATPDELAASLGVAEECSVPPTRAEIDALIERDANG